MILCEILSFRAIVRSCGLVLCLGLLTRLWVIHIGHQPNAGQNLAFDAIVSAAILCGARRRCLPLPLLGK